MPMHISKHHLRPVLDPCLSIGVPVSLMLREFRDAAGGLETDKWLSFSVFPCYRQSQGNSSDRARSMNIDYDEKLGKLPRIIGRLR